MPLTRRRLMSGTAATAVGFLGLRHLFGDLIRDERPIGTDYEPFGGIIPDPQGILDLPAGFRYRIISRTGERMDDGLLVPSKHDGMAAFAGPGGKTLLVRNHENTARGELWGSSDQSGAFGEKDEKLPRAVRERLYDPGRGERPAWGGTTTLVYDTKTQRLEGHFLSLAGTVRNCAGGPAPWGSWISCEETVQRREETFEQDHGFNFEVPATAGMGMVEPVPLRDMGRFNHEAIAVDPATGIVYQTEDRSDGLFYRFIPNVPGELAKGGRLQALVIRDAPACETCNWDERAVPANEPLAVRWVDVENVLSPGDDLRHQGRSNAAAVFTRGEGAWPDGKNLYFACTDGGRNQSGQIWRYRPSPAEGTLEEDKQPGTLELFLEPNDSDLLHYADNLTVAPWGDLIIAEDCRGVDLLVGVTPEGRLYHLACNAKNKSEFAGPNFSPDGSTLFVNIQTPGLTLAITGPWEKAAA